MRTELRDESNRRVVYYELPSSSESHLHRLMVEKIVALAWKLRLPVERRGDVDLAIGDVGVEVETGKKSRKPGPRPGYREVWIVVPNEEVRERYPGSMTLRELYLRMREMSEPSGGEHEAPERRERKQRPGPSRKSVEERSELAQAALKYVKRSMAAYLDGKKGLKWILGVVRSSGVRGELLMRVFEELESYGDRRRWEEALEACRRRGLL